MDQEVQDYLGPDGDPAPGRQDPRRPMGRVTGQEPAMWGKSIIGFGQYHYRYASGREGDAAAVGFAPRKAATTIYLLDGVGAYTDR